jgi:hypothetical protein
MVNCSEKNYQRKARAAAALVNKNLQSLVVKLLIRLQRTDNKKEIVVAADSH